MAWDGFRLPNFNNEVRWKRWPLGESPDYIGQDLNDWEVLTCQLYWGIKRGFRLPVAFLPVLYGQFPMMIKAPAGTPISMGDNTGFQAPDGFAWSANGFVYLGLVATVGIVSWGNPNEYIGAVITPLQIDPVAYGWTLPPGWPLS